MEVYKISTGEYVDYVSANSYTQAELSARALFPGTKPQVTLATPEEANALMRSHSYPIGDE